MTLSRINIYIVYIIVSCHTVRIIPNAWEIVHRWDHSLFPKKLWAASPKIMRLPLKIFYALGKIIFEPLDKKKLWVPCCKSALIDDWQWVGNLLLATSCRIQGKFNDPDEGRLVAQVAENSWEVNLSPQSSSLWTIISTIIDNYSQQCLYSFRYT